ncbi:hypothetical protein OIE68_09205 [Nocardia vinacea]|uniref:SecDF P1 head subdomain-containing protein n=1 Tax=Nocardia vinacea TaxID=96468 RepID=UPI002E0E3FA9|nr:hypothetical protein OIE68_09205 [Nocardia vinacea]
MTFKSSGSDTFSKFTSDNLGKRIAFALDSRVLSAPAIQSPTPPGSPTRISGNFTADSACQLANSLQFGALPLSFTVS